MMKTFLRGEVWWKSCYVFFGGYVQSTSATWNAKCKVNVPIPTLWPTFTENLCSPLSSNHPATSPNPRYSKKNGSNRDYKHLLKFCWKHLFYINIRTCQLSITLDIDHIYVDWILISGFWSLDTDAFLLISIIGQWKIHSEYWLISFSYSPQTILTAPQKIATGETSQAITSLDYFNLYHKIIFINTIE